MTENGKAGRVLKKWLEHLLEKKKQPSIKLWKPTVGKGRVVGDGMIRSHLLRVLHSHERSQLCINSHAKHQEQIKLNWKGTTMWGGNN